MTKALTSILILLTGSMTSWCQIQIGGTVTSGDDNSPIPGVSVVEKGTSNGTITQTDGHFAIDVTNSNSILVFQFIGYVSQEIPIGRRNVINVTLKTDCIRDWFDHQLIGFHLISGVISNPVGGQFDFTFPVFSKGTLATGVSYQTNFENSELINGQIEYRHITYNCNFNLDVNGFYRKVSLQNDFNSTAYSIESDFDFDKLGIIAGYSNLNINRTETSHKQGYSGAVIGITTWIKRITIVGKIALYKGEQEYFGQVTRHSRSFEAFIKYYMLDSFNELTLGIGKTFRYRLQRQRRTVGGS